MKQKRRSFNSCLHVYRRELLCVNSSPSTTDDPAMALFYDRILWKINFNRKPCVDVTQFLKTKSLVHYCSRCRQRCYSSLAFEFDDFPNNLWLQKFNDMASLLLVLSICILCRGITAEFKGPDRSDIPKSDVNGQSAPSDKDKDKANLRLVA